jgi:hypothetical protein
MTGGQVIEVANYDRWSGYRGAFIQLPSGMKREPFDRQPDTCQKHDHIAGTPLRGSS